ncbi:monocarboxylate transporter 11-like [Dermacentor variabilis]|uniref:monocarboxylate transporter 11-like n=1 Tax=Dermacentor variabilis TaxID=34621 RepID=UPI003F5B96DF
MMLKVTNSVDGRWDIAVLAGLVSFFGIATNRNSGWFFVTFMEEFQVDRRSASWPNSVLTIMFRSSGLLVALLQRYMSLFHVGLIGSIFLWGGIIASVFSPNITTITVTLGLLHGLGAGLVLMSNLVEIMQYFQRYRGIASGIKFAADPTSAIAFPALLSYLRTTYGFRGTLLIYAALTMHVTAFSIVLKEPPWMTQGSTAAVTAVSSPPPKEKRQNHSSLVTKIRHTMQRAPPELLMPSFYAAVLGSVLLDYVNAVHLSTLVDYALDSGVSRAHAELTVTYASAPEIAGRVLLPLVADVGLVSRPALAAGNVVALGAFLALTPETRGAAHVVLRAASSVALATLMTMKHVLVADYFGPDAVALLSGVSGVLLVPVLLSNPSIIGHFRDVSGAYDNLYRILAGMVLAMAVAFLAFICSSRKFVSLPTDDIQED